MPVIFRGAHICEKCNKKFEWINFEQNRQKINSPFFVFEVIPKEPKIHSAINQGNNQYELSINCPYCGFYNTFIHVQNEEIY